MKKIPYGYCHCGCGEKTTIIARSDTLKNRVKGEPNKFIIQHHNRLRGLGRDHPAWRGGRYVNDQGYVMVYAVGHPRACSNGYAREHILLAEKAYGGLLPEKAQVHHHGKSGDNTKIVICEDQQYHFLLHTRAKAFRATGDPSKRKCKFCQQWDDVDNLLHRQITVGKKGWNTYHSGCEKAYRAHRKEKTGVTA